MEFNVDFNKLIETITDLALDNGSLTEKIRYFENKIVEMEAALAAANKENDLLQKELAEAEKNGDFWYKRYLNPNNSVDKGEI